MDSVSLFDSFETIDIQQVNSYQLTRELDKHYYDLFMVIVERIRPVLRTAIARVACSFGKDSNVLLAASLHAHILEMKAGTISHDQPFIVSNIDTGVDNIFIRSQIAYEVRELKDYCLKQNVNLVYRTAQPDPRYSWAVMYLSGMKLPSFAKSSADCSVILKVDPAHALEQELFSEYGDVVTLLGVRSDESIRRGASVKRHGLSDITVHERTVAGRTVKTFAPLVDLTSEDIFGILRRSGSLSIVRTQFTIPTYKPHNKLLVKLYGDATDSCPVTSSTVSSVAGEQRGSCGSGSRFGCYLCLKVVKDKSADSMTRLRQYDRSAKVKLIRDWLAHHAEDMSLRTWVGKSVDPVTGAIVIQPNTFNAHTLEKLIYWLAQATRDDYLYAQEFTEKVKAGRISEDEGYREILNDPDVKAEDREFFLNHYVEFGQQHLIKPIDLEQILMICAIHARDGVDLPPYRALWIWEQVWNGNYIDWPLIVGNPPKDAVPDPRFYFGSFSKSQPSGLLHPLADDTSCSVASKVTLTSPVSVMSALGKRTSSAPQKFNFSRRKVVKKHQKNGVTKIEKGRMSVAFSSVKPVYQSIQSIEKDIQLMVPSTSKSQVANIEIWSDEDVESGFSIDKESLDVFLMTEYERCLEKHAAAVERSGVRFSTTEPFMSLVSYGLIRLNARTAISNEKMLLRTEQLIRGGKNINLLSMNEEQLLEFTVGQAEFRSKRAKKLLEIRASRNQHRRDVLRAFDLKERSPSLYIDEVSPRFIDAISFVISRSMREHAKASVLLSNTEVLTFDGISFQDYLKAAQQCKESALEFIQVDRLARSFGLNPDCIETRKSLIKTVEKAIEKSVEMVSGNRCYSKNIIDICGGCWVVGWDKKVSDSVEESKKFLFREKEKINKSLYNSSQGTKKFSIAKLALFKAE